MRAPFSRSGVSCHQLGCTFHPEVLCRGHVVHAGSLGGKQVKRAAQGGVL